jgi:hypothetical protein
MRKLAAAAAAVTIVVAASAAGEPKATAPSPSHHSDTLPAVLDLRLRSMELQIDILRDRDLIGREEAQDLRQEALRLQRRLERLPERQVGEVELAVDRLQRQLRFAADDGRLASVRRDLGRFDDGDRYQRDSHSDYDDHSYQRADPRGDPFAIWEERDRRGPH